jgi:hypothetical protein
MKIVIRIVLVIALLMVGFAVGVPVGQSIGFATGSEWAIIQADLLAREAGVFMPVHYEEGMFRVKEATEALTSGHGSWHRNYEELTHGKKEQTRIRSQLTRSVYHTIKQNSLDYDFPVLTRCRLRSTFFAADCTGCCLTAGFSAIAGRCLLGNPDKLNFRPRLNNS